MKNKVYKKLREIAQSMPVPKPNSQRSHKHSKNVEQVITWKANYRKLKKEYHGQR